MDGWVDGRLLYRVEFHYQNSRYLHGLGQKRGLPLQSDYLFGQGRLKGWPG